MFLRKDRNSDYQQELRPELIAFTYIAACASFVRLGLQFSFPKFNKNSFECRLFDGSSDPFAIFVGFVVDFDAVLGTVFPSSSVS